MAVKELKKDLYWTGVLDPALRTFDIIMETEFGTTYNAYLLKGSEKTALIETAKETFYDAFQQNLDALGGAAGIDYVIVDHTEPDHAGSVARLLEQNPSITVVGTVSALNFLKQIVNRDFRSLAVKENDILSLGDKTLRFFPLPNLHWPDTMYTWWEEEKVLFTCDSYGAHYSHAGILRSTVEQTEDYMKAAKYYFDNILGPFKPFMLKALAKTEELEPALICPGHGPVLDSGITEFLQVYRQWSRLPAKRQTPLVVIPYVSAYGYTGMLAQAIADGVRSAGTVEATVYNMEEADPSQVLAEIGASEGVLFGSPTILSEALKPIWDLATSLLPALHQGKCASAFGSYGWSGEAVPHLMERLSQLKMKTVEGMRVRFCPSADDLTAARQFGADFAAFVLQNRK